MLANAGVLNEHNAQELFDKMLAELAQAATGIFYADDVEDFAAQQVELLITE